MAIDVNSTKVVMRDQLMSDLAVVFGLPVSTYTDFATAIATAIGIALQHIKDDADVTGVTAGSDTVSGGVD